MPRSTTPDLTLHPRIAAIEATLVKAMARLDALRELIPMGPESEPSHPGDPDPRGLLDEAIEAVAHALGTTQLSQGGWEVRTPDLASSHLGWVYASTTGVEHWYLTNSFGRLGQNHVVTRVQNATHSDIQQNAQVGQHYLVVAVVSGAEAYPLAETKPGGGS